MKRIASMTACALLGAMMTGAASGTTVLFSENFDGLTPAADLNGQGGWTNYAGSSTAIDVVADPGFNGMSGNVALNNAGVVVDSQMLNSLSGSFNNTDLITLSFDARVDTAGGNTFEYLGLQSSDGNAGSEQTYLTFGVDRGNINLRYWNGTGLSGNSLVAHGITTDQTVRMQAVLDPTTLQVTVSYAVYSDETTLGAFTTTHSAVSINGTGVTLDEVDQVNLRIADVGTTAGVADNLLVTQVPEPGSLALLGLGGLLIARRRRA